MAAPNVTFTASRRKISAIPGFDSVVVTFSADAVYVLFECRATKVSEKYGVGVGALLASFSQTPANTERTFEIYDEYLLRGDGEYRISLYAKGEDGQWNEKDNIGFIPKGMAFALQTKDGKSFIPRGE